MHQHRIIEDTVYFWFASNNTNGSGNDGASPVYDVRLGGAAAGAIPVLSGSATLLTHANYPAGAHEVVIAATAGNGFAANNTYAVFCTLLVDSQNPTGFIGSFSLEPIIADLREMGGVVQSATDLKDFADAGYDPGTNKVQGVVLVDTTTTNTDMVGTDSAALASALTTHDNKIGTPVNIDSGGATIAENLKKLADDNGGADFDATTDSLERLANTAPLGTAMRGTDNAATAASLTTHDGKLDIVDSNVDAILLDTGTTGVIVVTNNDKTDYSLSTAGIQAIWDIATSALTTANSIGKLIVDNLNSTVSGIATAVWANATRTLSSGVTLTNAGIDSILTRAISNAEDSATNRCLLWAISKLTNKVSITSTTLSVKKTDDSTNLFTQTVTTDSGADPIIGVDTD